MERTMDRIAAELGMDRTTVRAANFIQPDEFPYDQGLIFQDGRPLIYDSGDYPAQLDMLKDMIGWDAFAGERSDAARQGRRARHRPGLLRRGHRPRTLRGRARAGPDRWHRRGGHRTDLAGPGPPDGVRPDRRRRTGRADGPDQGDHRRHPPVRLRRRHVRLPGRGDVRIRRGAGRPSGSGQGAAGGGRRSGVLPGRPRPRRRRGVDEGQPVGGHPARAGGRAVQPVAIRLRRGGQGGHPVRPSGGSGQAAGRR